MTEVACITTISQRAFEPPFAGATDLKVTSAPISEMLRQLILQVDL